jgi:hypothetical protein
MRDLLARSTVPASSLEELRCALEDERRKTLSFNRALDHIGFPPEKLDWTSLHALHERAADTAELLYGVERGHITPANVARYLRKANAIHEDGERLRTKIRGTLPKPFQKRLDLALPVANSTISRDDLYEDIRSAP